MNLILDTGYKEAFVPTSTALDALETISALYQYEAIDIDEKNKLTETARTLIDNKAQIVHDRLCFMFTDIHNRTTDRNVKKMCEKFIQM